MKPYIFFFLAIMLYACKTEKQSLSNDEDYKKEFKTYKAEAAEDRINYLQLTGLFKLDSLDNSFGKATENSFVINIDALPAQIGTVSVTTNGLSIRAAENVLIKTKEDSTITQMNLELNAYGSSIKLYHEQLNWQVITRSGQHYLRVWDIINPAVVAFKGFELYELNAEFITKGQFNYYEQVKSEIVKAEVDGKRSTRFIGKVTFNLQGETYSLDVGEGGFTMVSDDTTGDGTYGGGRYIYLDIPETDGPVTIDFNRLYNPPCAFSEFTTCLYPPRQNVLPIKILAGEKIKRL